MAQKNERATYPMETYEESRRNRYSRVEHNKQSYTFEALEMAYQTWAMKSPERSREYEWNIYCDVRDGVSLGTNEKIAEHAKTGGQSLYQ